MYKSYFRRYQLVCRSYSFSLFTVAQNLSLTLFGKINSINKASKALGLIKKAATKGLKRRIFTSFLSLNSHSKTECRGFDPFCPCHKRVTKKMPCEKLRFHRGFSRFWSRFFQYSFIDAKRQKTYSDSIRTRKLNI